MVVYEVDNVFKIYPSQSQPANDGISFQVQAGEIFGLLGDNGAGKSTLVRQMANLVRSTSGTIRLYGRTLEADPLFVPCRVGYMPQDGLALNNLTVGEALYFTAHLRGFGRAEARKETGRLLETWGLEGLQNKSNRKLSGGQKRLLQLAVALAGSPPVLLLDEPTNDLDPQRRKLVWDNLRRLNHEQGTTIFFITHDALEAEKIIQRVGILRAGRLVTLGKPAELKARIDNQLRLELFFSPQQPPHLPDGLVPQVIDAGRWQVHFDRRELNAVMACLDGQPLDDFRLSSATLEDLYLRYAGRVDSLERSSMEEAPPDGF